MANIFKILYLFRPFQLCQSKCKLQGRSHADQAISTTSHSNWIQEEKTLKVGLPIYKTVLKSDELLGWIWFLCICALFFLNSGCSQPNSSVGMDQNISKSSVLQYSADCLGIYIYNINECTYIYIYTHMCVCEYVLGVWRTNIRKPIVFITSSIYLSIYLSIYKSIYIYIHMRHVTYGTDLCIPVEISRTKS